MEMRLGNLIADISYCDDQVCCDITHARTGDFASLAYAMDSGCLRQYDDSKPDVPLTQFELVDLDRIELWAIDNGW